MKYNSYIYTYQRYIDVIIYFKVNIISNKKEHINKYILNF